MPARTLLRASDREARKPVALGGIAIRTGATGHSVALMTQWAIERGGETIENKRVAIQAFGNVGSQAARHLAAAGARTWRSATSTLARTVRPASTSMPCSTNASAVRKPG